MEQSCQESQLCVAVNSCAYLRKSAHGERWSYQREFVGFAIAPTPISFDLR